MATLGLGRRVEHPRILQAVERYPGRWTHHLLLTAPEDVDGLLAAAGWPRPTALLGKTEAPDPRRASVRLAIKPSC